MELIFLIKFISKSETLIFSFRSSSSSSKLISALKFELNSSINASTSSLDASCLPQTAMIDPTGTVSPSLAHIFIILPSSGDSISFTTFSVSISKIISPFEISSPFDLINFKIEPSFIDRPHLGIVIATKLVLTII